MTNNSLPVLLQWLTRYIAATHPSHGLRFNPHATLFPGQVRDLRHDEGFRRYLANLGMSPFEMMQFWASPPPPRPRKNPLDPHRP